MEKPTLETVEDLANNPHFDETFREKFLESSIEGGAWIEALEIGKRLEVLTQNTTYIIERREDGYYISGNPKLCPEPTRVQIQGSTFGGTSIRKGFIGRGMYLEFVLLNEDGSVQKNENGSVKEVTTSAIREVTELP